VGFVGFEPDRVRQFATALDNATVDAGGISGDIAKDLDEATSLMRSMSSPGPGWGSPWSSPYDYYRGGLTTVSQGTPSTVAEVTRRLDHLLACERLAADGFAVNALAAFDDARPPNEAAVRAATSTVRAFLTADHGINGNEDDLQRMLDLVSSLNPAEREAFVGALTKQDLEAWSKQASLGDEWLIQHNGMTSDQIHELSGLLLPCLDRAQVERVAKSFTVLEPEFHDLVTDVAGSYTFWPGDLGDDPPDVDALRQGALGDCWFLSGLGAVVRQDPAFVAQHLHDNANGTYTVTFYRDGKPIPITVDGALPTTADGNKLFVGSAGMAATGPLWAAIYEKAYASYRGRYGDTEGGWGDQAIEVLTGRTTHRSDPGEVSLEQIRTMLAAGQPVTVGTNSKFHWFWESEHDKEDPLIGPGDQLVASHEYAVRSVVRTDDGWHITVINPWGQNAYPPQVVTLDDDEFREYFGEVSWGE
jgi:Calpain family cysteine protease